LFRVKARGLAKDLPEVLHLDVSKLEIGQAIHIGDIQPPTGVEILGDKKISVLSVAAPVTEAEETALLEASTAATAGDVEMTKEKKEEGAEGAAPAADAKAGEKAPAAKAGEKAPAAAAAAPAKAAEKKK
jgi:large subunit ribosomal protein L25